MNAEGKFTLSAIRKLNKKVSLGEISSMRMVEIINEEMERYANHKTEQLQKEVEGLKGGNKERLDKFNQAMKDHLKERDSVQPTKEPTEVKCDKCKQDITFIGFCTNCDDI